MNSSAGNSLKPFNRRPVKMNRNIITFLVVILFSHAYIVAQNVVFKGKVTDSVNGDPLPYASIIVKGTTVGTTTDMDGNFELVIPLQEGTVAISYIGYDTYSTTISDKMAGFYTVKLVPSGISLGEVVVKPGKEKYRNKDNPAVAFVRKVIENRDAASPLNHDYFQYDRYEKMLFAMDDYQPKENKKGKKDKFEFVNEFVDTLDAGITILPVCEKERIEKVFYRKSPYSLKHLVKASKTAGVDEVFSRDGVQQFLGEVFKEIDIFQNNIPLFLQRFVSPLSKIGPGFYKYYLLDTLDIDNSRYIDLGFAPRSSESFGFTGHMLVRMDTTYFIKKIHMNVPHDINLNFVSRMTIEQEFTERNGNTRIMTKDDIQVNFKLTENSKGMYARRLNIYTGQSFDMPEEEYAGIFSESANVIVQDDAYNRSDIYWKDNRPDEGKRRNPNSVEKLMTRLRSVPLFYYTEKVVSVLVSGYIPTNKDPRENKFEFGPMNTTISGNAIEGARMRIGGTTTPVFNDRLFLDGYMAYGTRDEKLKYDALVEYSFNDKKEYRKEFPVHSLRFEYMYDINKLGQQYMYTNKDNILLSIRRQQDTRATYLRKAELTYYREHYNGIGYGAIVKNRREYATEYSRFRRFGSDGSITPVGSYDMTEMELKFRYGKDEKFYQTRNQRVPITYDALIFNLSHVMAKKGFLGSSYNYHRTDIGIQKRFWFSAFGYADLITKAGKVWTKVPYPMLVLPNANLTYTIQPEAYTNMNAMEFINDEYISWDLTYYMNGLIMNRIPLVKKLKLREVVCFRGLWGNLTDKNNPYKSLDKEGLYAFPDYTCEMGKAPYMELSFGIENIFKFMRLDYVWRLNYLDNPGIQTHGVRCTMKMSF